jgi:hypothetical protein
MQQIITITYLDIELLIWKTETAINASIHSICEGVGIPSGPELEHIRQNPVFNELVVTKVYEGKNHHFIPVFLLTAWLMSVKPELVEPQKLPLLHKLQRSVQLAIWGHFFGILICPAMRRRGAAGDLKSRNFVYNCPENSVREIQLSTASPYDLAVETLQAFSEIFGVSSPSVLA